MRRHGSQPVFPRAPSVHYTVVINRMKLLMIMADDYTQCLQLGG